MRTFVLILLAIAAYGFLVDARRRRRRDLGGEQPQTGNGSGTRPALARGSVASSRARLERPGAQTFGHPGTEHEMVAPDSEEEPLPDPFDGSEKN